MAYRRTIKEPAARSRASLSVSHSMRWNVGISTTSCAPSPPRPALALGDGHPPASPRSHEDFKATRTWIFLDAPEKRKAHGDRKISAWYGSRFARFSCCLSRENAPFSSTDFVCRYTRFFQPDYGKNICFDGFFLTGASKIRFRRQIFLCGRLLATSPFEEKSGEHPLEVAAFRGGADVFAQQSPRPITPESLHERAGIVRASGFVLCREAGA
jgi:hypothetical protein